MSVPTYYRLYELPWAPSQELEERFRKILRNLLIVYAVFALLMPFLPILEKEKTAQPDLPERVVQLIVEQPKPPPPPPKPLERKPEVKVVKVEPKPIPQPVPVDRKEEARKKAQKSGLVALADELADLRDTQLTANLTSTKPLMGAVNDGPQVERSLITTNARNNSGGINTAAMSRNTGGVALANRGTTQVRSAVSSLAAPGAAKGDNSKPARSREEIEMVFDQNKSAIYALYSRALRKDPLLQGKLVLRLTIEPSGVVSACEVVSSDLSDDEMLQKLVQRVKMFRFATKDVAAITTTKPIDFFPA